MKALAVLVVSLAFLTFACSGSAEPRTDLPPTDPLPPTEPSLPRKPSFNSVFFIDESTGWLTAYLGPDGGDVILKTSDGGETWEEQYRVDLPGGGIRGLQFVDALHGWAVMGDPRSPPEANRTLLGTTDAGTTWIELGKLDSFSRPKFVSHSVGWGRTWNTAGADLMQTTDAGRTWNSVATDADLGQVCFSDEKRGWSVRIDNTVLKTADGGRTWTESIIAQPDLETLYGGKIWCQANEVAWMLLTGGVGVGNQPFVLFRTTDGGDSWMPVAKHGFSSLTGVTDIGPVPGFLEIVDDSTAYFGSQCGPCNNGHYFLSRTNDAGETWEPKVILPEVDAASSVSFPVPEHGWVVGRSYAELGSDDYTGSLLLRTSDGGETWQRVDSLNLTLTFR